jgi:hypothetical protein
MDPTANQPEEFDRDDERVLYQLGIVWIKLLAINARQSGWWRPQDQGGI